MNQYIASLVFLLGCVPYVFAHNGEEHAGAEEDNVDSPWKKQWMAHGICASIAWAILVPLAIGSSLLRKTLEKLGFHESTWFRIHFTLNTLAALLTVASFSIAVYICREEYGKSNWKEHTHFIVGLVIFLLTLIQAVVGMLRPRRYVESPTKGEPTSSTAEGTEEEQQQHDETVEVKPAKKSMAFVVWEANHRIFGVGLLAISWWNIYSGWELFGEEVVDGEDFGSAWLGVGGGVLGAVIVLYAIQMIRIPN